MQMVLRSLLVTAMAASLVAVAAPGADAHHRPKSYCSDSGDICQSVRKLDGVRNFRILLGGRYFRRYVLCVSSPLGYDACKTFRIQLLSSSLYGDSVRAGRHFSIRRRGSYTVSWHRVPEYGPPTELIGRRLGFHVR